MAIVLKSTVYLFRSFDLHWKQKQLRVFGATVVRSTSPAFLCLLQMALKHSPLNRHELNVNVNFLMLCQSL